jgi:hypothetical protein
MLKLVSTKIGRSTFSRMPLRVLLIVPFVLQVSVAVGVTGWLSIRNGERAVNEVASQLRNEVGHRIEGKLEEYLAVPHLVNEINLNAIQQGYIDPENPEDCTATSFTRPSSLICLNLSFLAMSTESLSAMVVSTRAKTSLCGADLPWMGRFSFPK